MSVVAATVDNGYSDLKRPETFNFAVDVVDRWASRDASMEAMYWVSQDCSQRRSLTFQHFSTQSHRIARLFHSWGVKKGDVMIMVLPRTPVWWEVALAGLRSGIIISPGPSQLTSNDLAYRCVKSKATVFVGDDASVSKVQAIRAQCPNLRYVVQVDGTARENAVSLEDELQSIEPDAFFETSPFPSKTPAMIYFTSGTSGPPKMVLHNQISFPLASKITAKYWHRLEVGDLFWNTADQGWAKAGWSLFGTWNVGASLFVYDDRRAFSAQRMLKILHLFPITTVCAPPLAWRQLASRQMREYFIRHPPLALRHCTAAGEALNDEVIVTWRKLSGLDIHDGYGQTETILLCANGIGATVRPGSMGKPPPMVPLAVIDVDGRECKADEEGNIAVELPDTDGEDGFFGLFDGYIMDDGSLGRPLQTAVHRGVRKTWFLTGDRARRDRDGYFWFVGRADDVINSSGYRIGPFEVESTLKQHPSVAESAVVSSPDPVRGEIVKAFVVLNPDHENANYEALVKELQDFCKTHAAPYKYPRKIQFVTADFLPKTATGKIQRSVLRKAEWQGQKEKL